MGNEKEDPKAKSRAAAVASVDALFKDMKFKSSADRERMASQLVERLAAIYDSSSNASGLTEPDVIKESKKAVNEVLGRAPSAELAAANAKIVEDVKAFAGSFSTAKVSINTQITTLVDNLAKYDGAFADVRAPRRMKMVNDLQSLIPAALNTADMNKDTLKKLIADKLSESSNGGLPEDVNKAAEEIAAIALETDKTLKAEVASKLSGLRITSSEGGSKPIGKDEMDAIVAKVNERIWPSLLREKLDGMEGTRDRTALIASVLNDAIKSNADIDPKSVGDLDKKIADAAARIKDYGANAGETETRTFIREKIGVMAGGSMFGNLTVSTGTAVGAGAGAMLGLAAVGKAKTTMDYVKGIGALALGAGLGAAYDNGAFDSLLKPNTPKANNGPGGTSVT